MVKFLEHLQEAERTIQSIDHMIYITLPLVKDKRLLFKILTDIKSAIVSCINAILQYEYINERIVLYKSAKENFETFVKRCTFNYKITQREVESIIELFDIIEKYKDSPVEFLRDEKIVILSESMKVKTITIEKIKLFLLLAKNMVKKAKEKFIQK
jgi:CRISPR/Cas system CMR subunit Cmr4 (Cas7 group RAMP superfamily)